MPRVNLNVETINSETQTLIDTARSEQRAANRAIAPLTAVGDVVLVGGAAPKYLHGQQAVVVHVAQSTVEVAFTNRVRKYGGRGYAPRIRTFGAADVRVTGFHTFGW